MAMTNPTRMEGGTRERRRAMLEENKEERIPVRQHSLPHDPHHLCKRVSWLENFYDILYACQVEGIDIPFTVVYQYCKPYAAFFTDGGHLRKIESKDLEVPNPAMKGAPHNHAVTNILEEFMPEKSVHKPLALHKCHTGVEAMRVFSRDPLLQGDKDLVVEYQNAEDVNNFLLHRAKDQNGIIQRFVQPNTPKVVSYKVYWTPYHVQIESMKNNHLADAADLPLERRCCTFDGHQNDVSMCALNKAVEKKIQEATNKIVTAIKRLVPRRVEIQVLVLHFKASSNAKVWLLYCSSLRLLDTSEERPAQGGKTHIGASEVETRRRLYAVTTDRPRTARAEEPQLPMAKGKALQKRKGRVCVLNGTFLGKDGHLKYNTTFQDIMLHFLWHGLSTGFEKVGNMSAVAKAVQDEERIARLQKLSSPTVVRRSLRHLLTGDPSCPLLFVKDKAAAQKALDEDDVLRAAYRLWKESLVVVFSGVLDNLSEEIFDEKRTTDTFLQQAAPVCEDVLLELSSSLGEILGWDQSQPLKRVRPSKKDTTTQITRAEAATRTDKENLEPTSLPSQAHRSRRSVSCPPGRADGVDGEKGVLKSNKSVKWGDIEEEYSDFKTDVRKFGHLSAKEAQELAQRLMQEGPLSPAPSFFGTMHGSRWRHPHPDAERFIRNEVNRTEYLYWFHLYASIGLVREQARKQKLNLFASPPKPTHASGLSFEAGTHMTFRDIVNFLYGVGFMPLRVSRASAAHVFHTINNDHSVNDDEVRMLDANEFLQYMKKLLPQVVLAER
jgi:hypothetical protein